MNLNLKKEATLSKDVEKSSKAKKIIDLINQEVSSYTKNTPQIKYQKSSGYNEIIINLNDLIITFRDVPSQSGNLAELYPSEKGGKSVIKVYNCDITANPLKLNFNESNLYHELIHYFDFKKIKNPKDASLAGSEAIAKGNYGEYVNSPVEFNAHFFHIVMPEILKNIENSNKVPKDFNEFKTNITTSEVNKFYKNLNQDNKQRFLKRIGSYWTSLKSTNISDHEGNIDDLKLNNVTKSWIERVKNAFNLNESQIFILNKNNMKVNDLKKVIKKVITESKNKDKAVKTTPKKPVAKKAKKEKMCERDEVGTFHMVKIPHKNSSLEEILKTSTLREFIGSGENMSEVVGVFKNENAARKLAEELLNHRTDVLQELKEGEIQEKMNEAQNLKALIAATESYYSLKPQLDEDQSKGKLDELNSNLTKVEEAILKLKEEKDALNETRPGAKPAKKKVAPKKKDDKAK